MKYDWGNNFPQSYFKTSLRDRHGLYGHMLIFILPLLIFFGFLYRWSKGKELRREN